jgi:hypothetical protein
MYKTDAEKQRAYRLRNLFRKPVTNRDAKFLLKKITQQIADAAQTGDAMACRLNGGTERETANRLLMEFEARANGKQGYVLQLFDVRNRSRDTKGRFVKASAPDASRITL